MEYKLIITGGPHNFVNVQVQAGEKTWDGSYQIPVDEFVDFARKLVGQKFVLAAEVE